MSIREIAVAKGGDITNRQCPPKREPPPYLGLAKQEVDEEGGTSSFQGATRSDWPCLDCDDRRTQCGSMKALYNSVVGVCSGQELSEKGVAIDI